MKSIGLKNKVVVVTGAATGIGRATGCMFAQESARVAAWDINDTSAEELTQHFRDVGADDVLFQKVNVANSDSVDSAVKDLVARWGRVDVLVNNAGITRDGQLIKYKDGAVLSAMSDEQFDVVVDVNLKGVFHCTRAVVPHMIAAGGGVVLNASSIVGLYGNFGQSNYVATKSGVIGMTKTWARELGRYKIRVNAVAPGFIATDMIKTIPEKVLDSMRQKTPLGRLGEPEDVAAAYVWLASDQASFISGTVLSVDGGLVMGT